MTKKNQGFSLIELLIVVTVIAIFVIASLVFYRGQLIKGRDARRKASLNRMQKILEDYLNDVRCYPNDNEITTAIPSAPSLNSICNHSFSPYASQLPCDSLNNRYYHFFYSIDSTKSCQKWYKIYTRLENTYDPIIDQLGCRNLGCGPSGNYNYWVSSPNVKSPAQQTGETWPVIPELTPLPSVIVTTTPTAAPTSTLSPTPSAVVSGTPSPTIVPTATPTPFVNLTPTPTPSTPPGCQYYGCFSQHCQPIIGQPLCATNYLDCGTPPCMGEDCCRNDCPYSTVDCH